MTLFPEWFPTSYLSSGSSSRSRREKLTTYGVCSGLLVYTTEYVSSGESYEVCHENRDVNAYFVVFKSRSVRQGSDVRTTYVPMEAGRLDDRLAGFRD
jgi:hypothetical protein